MKKRNLFSKSIAWLLITTLVNPALMAPAFSRDTDIFLSTTTGSTTAEPNIMIVLDTSDSMNLPEAWREYSGAYDSHIEYLWNDINVISNTEQTTESGTKISTADATTVAHPLSPYGFWAGATLADRRAIWNAARIYANATQGGDPGARSTWRNYSEGSPSYPALSNYYWLPAGTSDSDPLLRSPSFNRFRGYQSSITGTRGGLIFPGTTDYSSLNACSASQGSLIASTVFRPSATPRNAGVYPNDQWFRWEPYAVLDAQNVAVYPGSQTVTNGYIQGYLDSSILPPGSWSPLPASRPARDNTGGTNASSQGQPIRLRNAVNSGATWRNVAADLGGYEFQSYVNGLSGSILQSLRGTYAYTLLAAVGAAGTVPAERFSAWLGNRDALPNFEKSTGTPAYYDATSSPLTACDPLTGPGSGTCINVTTGGSANITLTKTRACTYNAGLTELDASGTTRRYNGTCTGAAVVNVCGVDITCSGDTNGVAYPNYSDVANPAPCTATTVKQNTFININYQSCAWSPARSSVAVAACAWSAARTSVYVEGQGYYYYGGTCTENSSTSSCTAGGSTLTVNSVSRPNVMGPYTTDTAGNKALGCTNALAAGTYYYGSTCQGNNVNVGTTLRGGTPPGSPLPGATGPATANCTISGTTASQTIRGTAYANTVLNNATNGCNNNAQNNQTCSVRGGYGGVQCDNPTAATACPAVQTSLTGGGTSATNNYYLVANQSATTTNLVHDCKADAPAANGGAYMRGGTLRTFATAYNTTNTDASATASYTTVAGNSVNYDSDKNIDVYSVNYLNWKFGPKGPNGDPIGRKTRLQIAKDALSGLVQNTDGIRFGLTVFNKTASCSATTGSITAGTNQLTVDDATQFTVGDPISIGGANATGAVLNSVVTAVSGTTYTIATSTTNLTTTGNMTAGSHSLTAVGTVTGYAIGQSIKVAGAGVAGADLVVNITNISGSTFTLGGATAGTTVAGAVVSIAAGTTVSGALVQRNPCTGSGNNEGANVAYGVKRMGSNASDTPDYNNRSGLITAINNVVAQARTPLTESVYEAYRYFSGRTPKFGTSNVPASVGTVSAGRDTSVICTSAAAGSGCTAIGAYKSPMLNNPNTTSPAGCQKNFIVLLTDGGPEDDWSANADIKSMSWSGPLGVIAPRTGIDATQGDTTTDQIEASANTPFGPQDIASTAFDNGYIWLDELVYFMGNADISPRARNFTTDSGTDTIAGRQSVNTYTIGFAGANSPVLQNAALRGNGVYYTADNSAALSAALLAALAAIVNWNPTVAAPTVPISALNRSENATDVYLAFFQPDPSSAWLGTVKKFQLSQYPNNGDAAICGAGVGLCLIGQTSLTKSAPNPSPTRNIETVVVDTITGISQSQVDINASSFWAPSSVTDGSHPDQGGSGYQLVNNTSTLTPNTRNVYTFLTNAAALQNGNSGSVVDLTNTANKVHFSNASNISKCRLGDVAACGGTATMTAAQQETLINWIRGGDTATTANCSDGTSSTCTTWRTWPHADVQHSKPAIVTYQASTPIIQYMYYVQNNGLLTAIDTATGIEKWSFMIEEALPKISSMTADAAGQQIDVADGTPTIYVEDVNGDGNITGTDKVWLYFGLRRGGRVYYAIDITQPDSPQFGWKIDANSTPAKICLGNGVCSNASQYNELGQTWSNPFVGKVRANTSPVLIFGGGYDAAEDTLPPGARTMGRAIFVVDAFTGSLVQSWGTGQAGTFLGSGAASMIYPIPSDVTALNTDLDSQGFLDRLYVGDTWGNVWRFDVDDASVSNWRGKLLATLSSDISTGERRKILFQPAVVKQNSPFRFDAVYVGTGDREHPLCLTANQVTPTVMSNSCSLFAPANKMFMVIDPDYGLSASNTSPVLVSDLSQRLTTDLVTNTSNTILNTRKGWYRDYDNGEKSANAPTVFSQRLRFGTYAPLGQSNGACVPPGEGRLNEIDAITGDLVPINGSVTQASDRYYSTFITHGYISTGQLIVQGKNIYHIVVSDSRLQSVLVGSMGSATKIYWYMEPEQ